MKKTTKIFATLLLSITTAFAGAAADFSVGNFEYDKKSDGTVKLVGHSGDLPEAIEIPSAVEFDGATYSVTEIGTRAFQRCGDMTSVTIPGSITSIGEYAFFQCNSMTSVHITDLDAWFNIDFIGFDSNPLEKAHSLYLNGSEVKELVIPSTITEIGSFALRGCNITSLTIPKSVTKIDRYAIATCESLTSLTIPNSVTEIGESAFSYCTAMTSITIGNSVNKIGSSAFNGTLSLTTIYSYTATPPAISDDTFININYVDATLYVPSGSVDTYKADAVWSKFQKIVDGGYTGVDDAIAAGAAEVTGYYNLQGVRADEPWHGLNIVVYNDGSCRKVTY